MIRGFQSQTLKQHRVSELCLQSHFSCHFISSDTVITCTLVFLQSDLWPVGAWLHEQLFDIYFIFLLYHTHFKVYCEDRIINFFAGFWKMSVNVSLFLGALNVKLIFQWIKKSICTCFTGGRMILRATRKTLVVKFLLLQSSSLPYAIGRCQRPVLIAFSCSTESSVVLHSPMLNGIWKKMSYA